MNDPRINFTTPEELGKVKFEVRLQNTEKGLQKAIFIGGELLDWSIDMESYVDAVRMGPMYVREIQRSIEIHFIESVSDFLGRKVSMDDIKEAINTGWI